MAVYLFISLVTSLLDESVWVCDCRRGALTAMAAMAEQKLPAHRAGGTAAAAGGAAGMFGWLRANLFSSPGNSALTLLCIVFIAWAVPPLLRFFIFDAVWSGADREACLASPANPDPGACWAFVRVWFSYFVYGFYPLVRALARGCVLRGAGIRHRLARLAFGAAPRPWRRLFLRCAAGPVLCAS